ncbi:MAG: zinc metallopeptidase, partial [Clostridia bacterium]|nr:zinc metallopeptidase [Clostridia bacterium]
MPYIDTWYIVLVIPAVILSLIASASVKSTYSKYSKVLSLRGMTGGDLASEILRRAGIYDVRVELVRGQLTDHYSPKENVIRLSEGVYGSSSVAALGVAAHEAGHDLQYYGNYAPIRIRNSILPVVNLSSGLSVPILLLGYFLGFSLLVNIGIALFFFVVLFQLITLPVEFNASSRGMQQLESCGALSS